MSELLRAGGVFGPISEHRDVFEQVSVNPESRTVEWPGEVDLDPEVSTTSAMDHALSGIGCPFRGRAVGFAG